MREGSVLSMGVFIGASTKIVDRETGEIFMGEVPAYSVVVPGTMPGKPLPNGAAGPEPLLRGDRQARRRADARQDQHQRAAAGLSVMSRRPCRHRPRPVPLPLGDAGGRRRARVSGGMLKAAGFTVHRLTFSEPGPDVENLYARLGTGAPHLVFAGHTDVVPPGDEDAWTHPPFAGEIADGELFGRGAVDMKGGIACFARRRARHIAARGACRRGLDLVPDHRRRGRRRRSTARRSCSNGRPSRAKNSTTASSASPAIPRRLAT